MSDQADKLRGLVHEALPGVRAEGEGARVVVVTGCRAGVGATTVAVNVGAVLADRGERVLVVEAGERSNLIEIAGVRRSAEQTLTDVLAGKCKIGDAIVDGPAGMRLLTKGETAARERESANRRETATAESVFRRDSTTWGVLQKPRSEFDVIVIDTGHGLKAEARRYWLRAAVVLLVTAADDAAVMDAYAAIKSHTVGARDATTANIRLLVNQAMDERTASDVHRRVSHCCQRFLREELAALPALARFDDSEDASVGLRPRVWESPNSEFGRSVLWLGKAVGDLLEARGVVQGARRGRVREVVVR